MNAASDASSNLTLADFKRDHRSPAPHLSSRLTALGLTAALAGLLVFFATNRSLWTAARHQAPAETVTELIRDRPREKVIPPPPPEFLAHLIRPRAETAAAPAFTIAPDTPPAPATLPASAARISPMAGGAPGGTGTGAGARGGSGTGGNGNGEGSSGCWDAAWSRAVTARVRHTFYYPQRARDQDISGVVVLRLTVRRNGTLETLAISKSSGNALLDAAAYDAMNRAQPLPRIPDRMHVDKVSALFPMIYGAADSSDATPGDCKT